MKKIITVAIAVALTLPLQAEEKQGYFYGVRFESQDAKGGSDAMTYGMQFGKHVNDWLDLSISTRLKDQNEGANGNDTRLEAGAKLKHKLNTNWSTSLYLGTGEKYVTNNNYGYWAITPGLKYKINQDWSVGTSVRFRDSYDTSHKQKDTTYAVKLGYKLADDITLDTRFRVKRGDSDYDAIGMGLTFEF
ncbi:porin family protein [Methylophilaceae bacterium]|nr:porin family protein [Methylophilaceae bacterium]